MFRRSRRRAEEPAPDPLAGLSDPWLACVADVAAVPARFERLLAEVPDGPLRDQVGELAERLDAEARFASEVARRAQGASGLVGADDVDRLTGQLKAATRRMEAAPPDRRPAMEAEVAQLRAAYRSAHEVLNDLEGTEEALRRLAGEMEAAYFAAVRLAARQAAAPERAEVAAVLERIEALHGALRALGPPVP